MSDEEKEPYKVQAAFENNQLRKLAVCPLISNSDACFYLYLFVYICSGFLVGPPSKGKGKAKPVKTCFQTGRSLG